MVSVAWAGTSGFSQFAGDSTTVGTIPPGSYGDFPFLAFSYSVGSVLGAGAPTIRTLTLVLSDLTVVPLPVIQAGTNIGAYIAPGTVLDLGATLVMTSTGGPGTAPNYGAFGAALISWDASVVGYPIQASGLMAPAAPVGGTLDAPLIGSPVVATTPFAVGAVNTDGINLSALTFVNADSPWCSDVPGGSIIVDYAPTLTGFARYRQAALGLWVNQDPLLPNYHYHLGHAPNSSGSTVGRWFFPTPGVPVGGRGSVQVIG